MSPSLGDYFNKSKMPAIYSIIDEQQTCFHEVILVLTSTNPLNTLIKFSNLEKNQYLL